MDFSGGIRATRVFQEAMPTANVSALFVQVYMTLLELMKVSPDGVEMSELRRRIHTADKEELNKQTFSRWVNAMADSAKPKSLLNLGIKERKPLIELVKSDLDPRGKKIKLTAEGIALAQRMSRSDMERSYLDIQLEGYQYHIDWMNSDEMKYVQSLGGEGLTWDQLEEKLEAWRKENPNKTWFSQRNTSLEFDVPDDVDERWLSQFNDGWEKGEERQRKMLEDVGMVADDVLLRMMSAAQFISTGKVRIDIPKDMYKEDGRMSVITAKFVAKAKMLGVMKRNGWDKTGLNIERILHKALDLEEAVLKPSANPRGPNDFDLVNTKTGEVEGGLQVKATTNHPAGSNNIAEIVLVLNKQFEDFKAASEAREQKLLDQINKLTDQLMETGRG